MNKTIKNTQTIVGMDIAVKAVIKNPEKNNNTPIPIIALFPKAAPTTARAAPSNPNIPNTILFF